MTHLWSYIDTTYEKVKYRDLFGLENLPDQYEFAFVPRNAEVLGLLDSTPSSNVPDILPLPSPNPTESSVPTPKLSSSSNLAKGMVALLQLLYTSFTVYHTNGDQVNRYGFAAPGLTVLPYAVMSGLNLLASLVAPHYPKVYLVRSSCHGRSGTTNRIAILLCGGQDSRRLRYRLGQYCHERLV